MSIREVAISSDDYEAIVDRRTFVYRLLEAKERVCAKCETWVYYDNGDCTFHCHCHDAGWKWSVPVDPRPGDAVRFVVCGRHWPPIYAQVLSVYMEDSGFLKEAVMVLAAPEVTGLRQTVFVNTRGETFTFWIGDGPELKERSIAVLSNGQTLRIQTLCVRLRPADVPPAAVVLALEEVEYVDQVRPHQDLRR